MTIRPLSLLGFLALLLVAPAPAAAGKRKLCRRTCGTVIADCVALGGRPRACRRTTIRRCLHDTSTCSPFRSTTTTTLPPSTFGLRVDSAETLYEFGLAVPAPGLEFVRVELQVRNDSANPVTPSGLSLYSAGVGYLSYFPTYPQTPASDACNGLTVVPAGGSFGCSALFQLPDGSTSGFVQLQAFGPFPAAAARSDDFDIPIVPRPFAGLAVLGVQDASGPACAPRRDFRMLRIGVELSSHNGASELALNGYEMSVVADGARYQPAYCTVDDPCDQRIGVPIDGTASCSVVFEVPVSVDDGTIEFRDARYPASATFTAPPS